MEMFKSQIDKEGFTIIESVYSESEIGSVIKMIEEADTATETFRKSANLFAIRQFLNEISGTVPFIINDQLRNIIASLFGNGYFVVKSIYFDKPAQSNWFVAYHQDLTISVDKKRPIEGYGPWTVKQNQFAVQPPLEVLENIYTVRIHLDDTDGNNGALKVIPGSHRKNIYRPETIDWNSESEITCDVPRGGIMVMKPLVLHSSGRTINSNKRRVIHIEFSNMELPEELQWAERLEI